MENVKKVTQFNRLVLIGNGFDLALGLKTGYSDFLLWLLKKYLLQTLEEKPRITSDGKRFNVGFFTNETFEIGIKQNYSNISYQAEINKLDSFDTFEKFRKTCDIDYKVKSNLLNYIIKQNNELGWVDIESLFYQELKNCFDKKPENIIKVNKELDFLSHELELYLKEIDVLPKEWQEFSGAVNSQLTHVIEKKELDDEHLLSKNKFPDLVYFLNFNYTKALFAITQYIESWIPEANIESRWNSIHGQINNPKAPIIFGFGDETDKDYEKIEDLNNNSFFEHIKSFKYSQTSNYQNLIKFLDSAHYQVCIYGHSCGLSDRTMLKEIFEHDNCKSIKIFYYKRQDGSDDFLEKTMEISRHFSDKASMRRKVVNKEYSQAMHQNIL